MPTLQRELTLEEFIVNTIKLLSESPDDVEVAKENSCEFFRSGKSPGCRFCYQPDATVLECKNEFLERIEDHPMWRWEPSFEVDEVREKKALPQVAVGMVCKTCYIADHCPLYKRNSTCAIDWGKSIAELGDPKAMMDSLIKMQAGRIEMGRLSEQVDGGVPDANLSLEMDRMANLIRAKKELDNNKFSFKMEMENNSPNAGSEGGGILRDLFKIGQPKENALPPATQKVVVPIEEAVVIPEKKPNKQKQKGKKL
jgi:hypothetical protein